MQPDAVLHEHESWVPLTIRLAVSLGGDADIHGVIAEAFYRRIPVDIARADPLGGWVLRQQRR